MAIKPTIIRTPPGTARRYRTEAAGAQKKIKHGSTRAGTAVVQNIDVETEYWNIVNRLKDERAKRVNPPLVRLWDGNWILRGRVGHAYAASFQEIDSETGIGKLEMPKDYYLSQWVVDHDSRPTKNIHVTVDKDGVRWSGRMDRYEIEKSNDGKVVIRVIFKHDYEEFKHILCWANPFLPAEIQFPRLWILFGPAKWALKTTLFCNILRLESSLFMLPDDPMDARQWFDLDQSTWSMVVKPDTANDTSVFGIVLSRFKDFHTVAKNTLEDAQLTPTFRRWLTGDPPAWEGANLRHGCLVIDIEDKSAWTTGTSGGGDIFSGLVYWLQGFDANGFNNDGTTPVADPAWPGEYYEPGWKGVLPQAPTLIYREGEHTGIQTSLFTGSPPKDVQHVTGGHSAPGVNELISAAINMAGDIIAAMIGIPPIGGMVDALLKPLYTDVFLAFMAWKDTGRAQSLGFSHYRERFAGDPGRAYTISALLMLRASLWATRETFTHKLTVLDGMPWIVGQQGFGQFYIGDRIGSTVRGAPLGKIYIDRVSEITLHWDRKTAPTWDITIGQRKPFDPVAKAFERIQELMGAIHELGLF